MTVAQPRPTWAGARLCAARAQPHPLQADAVACCNSSKPCLRHGGCTKHCTSAVQCPCKVQQEGVLACQVFLQPPAGHMPSRSPTRNSAGARTLARRAASAAGGDVHQLMGERQQCNDARWRFQTWLERWHSNDACMPLTVGKRALLSRLVASVVRPFPPACPWAGV